MTVAGSAPPDKFDNALEFLDNVKSGSSRLFLFFPNAERLSNSIVFGTQEGVYPLFLDVMKKFRAQQYAFTAR